MKFVKGQSGNPKGRPKIGTSLTEWLRTCAAEIDPVTGQTNGEKLSKKMWHLALVEGNLDAMKHIYDRVDGKVPNAPEPNAEDETILAVADL